MEIAYLILTTGQNETYAKIGRTDDWEASRHNKYRTHNPIFELCATIPTKNAAMSRQIEWAFGVLMGHQNSKDGTEWYKVTDMAIVDEFRKVKTLYDLLIFCNYYAVTRSSINYYRGKLEEATARSSKRYYQERLNTMIELLSY
ncbi:MAG: hypothetical protein GX078_01880 [Clostridiales bacterium]|nr:hypothetical protein [Clostridiales bacterium]